MNIGIRLHDTRPGTLRERLAYAAEQGFSCVQLAMGKAVPGFRMEEAPALLTEDLAAEVKEELERAGMECAVLGCYLKLAAKDEEEALRVRKIYRAHLRFAARIGARCTGTETPPAAGPEGSGCRTEEQYRLFLDRVRPVVREAEETGVTALLRRATCRRTSALVTLGATGSGRISSDPLTPEEAFSRICSLSAATFRLEP